MLSNFEGRIAVAGAESGIGNATAWTPTAAGAIRFAGERGPAGLATHSEQFGTHQADDDPSVDIGASRDRCFSPICVRTMRVSIVGTTLSLYDGMTVARSLLE